LSFHGIRADIGSSHFSLIHILGFEPKGFEPKGFEPKGFEPKGFEPRKRF
jgi:hypothetical protein